VEEKIKESSPPREEKSVKVPEKKDTPPIFGYGRGRRRLSPPTAEEPVEVKGNGRDKP